MVPEDDAVVMFSYISERNIFTDGTIFTRV